VPGSAIDVQVNEGAPEIAQPWVIAAFGKHRQMLKDLFGLSYMS
jgi:hypothetical protein